MYQKFTKSGIFQLCDPSARWIGAGLPSVDGGFHLDEQELSMSRIDDLISQMTLDEKISMLAGADLWHSVAVPRLGIPQFKVTDGPNGR